MLLEKGKAASVAIPMPMPRGEAAMVAFPANNWHEQGHDIVNSDKTIDKPDDFG